MNTIPPSLGLVVVASVTFARALWTQKRNFLAGERTHACVQCRECSLNATAVGRRRAFRSRSVTSRSVFLLPLAALAGTILLASTLPRAFAQGMGGGTDTPGNGNTYEGPVGVTGIFNGNITTGCSYDPLTRSAKREVVDIPPIPGSIGKYPLKMTRYYNSRAQYYASSAYFNPAIGLGPGWSHEYSWLLWSGGNKVVSPQGSASDFTCGQSGQSGGPIGVSEGWVPGAQYPTWRLADGGQVVFDTLSRPKSIIDPYGLTTTITYDDPVAGQRKVTEPGGRYLLFIYDPSVTDPDGTRLLTRVEAHGSGDGTVTDSVNYHYGLRSPGGSGQQKMMLLQVDYSDSTHAYYDYDQDNVYENPPTSFKMYPVLVTCTDVRYNGPMRQINYEYIPGGQHGAIIDEKSPGIGPISTIASGLVGTNQLPYIFTETRADGPTRTFTYSQFFHCQAPDCGVCDDTQNNTPRQQLLQQYTDFNGRTTYLGYDSNGYVNSVADARGYTTLYQHGPLPPTGIGQITQITLPADEFGHSHTIAYAYYPDPHYLMTITDQRGNVTSHARDSNHRITNTDYQDANSNVLVSEHFTYDDLGLGLVKTHRMKNYAYQHFQYDSRGLLVAKTIPTWNSDYNSAMAGPTITYSYYTSGPWTDRVLTMTLPANVSGFSASETYEYDRAFGANGVTDPNGSPVAGRGLVTKITYADSTSKSFTYDVYGNKLSETNELGHQTNYGYDSYNRLTSVTDPLSHTTTYSYEATNGSQNLSALLHTTSSVHLTTTPTGIVTENRYDANFRKVSTTQGYGTSSAVTTLFQYDLVGNPTVVTDPRNNMTVTAYDARNRKISTTEASGTSSAETTLFHYGDGINITSIDRADGTTETKGYDAMNRVHTDTVPQTSTANLTTVFYYYAATVPSAGMLEYVRDPKGETTTLEYNPSRP
jgi:YD repeat-containing protein